MDDDEDALMMTETTTTTTTNSSTSQINRDHIAEINTIRSMWEFAYVCYCCKLLRPILKVSAKLGHLYLLWLDLRF